MGLENDHRLVALGQMVSAGMSFLSRLPKQ